MSIINPIEDIGNYVVDWLKSLQEYVDNLSPVPDADNSMLPLIGLPYHYDATALVKCTVSNCSDDYSDSGHGYGYQQVGFAHRVTLINNEIRLTGLNFQGKILTGNPGTWDRLTTSEQDDAVSQCENVFDVRVSNDHPNSKFYLTYASGTIAFNVQGYSNSLHFEYKTKNGWQTSAFNGYTNTLTNGRITDAGSGLINGPFREVPLSDELVMNNTAIIAIMSSDTYAQRLANDIPSVNRSTMTKVCLSGATYKLYYGDTYLIYAIDDSKIYTFYDIYDGTKTAAQQINDWTPGSPVIHVPTYNEVKYGPEPEPTIDDDYVDMGLGVETNGMAMYNMAVVTRQELFDLITDFEANSDTGLSFIPHILGLYKLGISSSQLLTTITDKIRLHKEPGKTAFASVADYSIVDKQEIYIDCGSILVDREELLTNTFLDFSPYTTYEMFIPGCGWITLPDTIVGRNLTVSIIFDLTTCSCKGIVRCGTTLLKSGTTIATVNGIIGSSVPLSINETGLQKAAIMNGSTQAAMALGTAFMGFGIGNPYMGASGVAMATGALASNHIAGNSTYTNTKGGATDYSIFGDGWKAVLKITRPVLEVPDNYGHTVGFVVNRYDTLSNFSGFTVCINPHIHISATSDEKEEIKRLLESGIILPDGE